MKAWRSLRVRLIFSYVALALALLTFSGYVFSNALAAYAIAVQRAQTTLYLRQAVSILTQARRQSLSSEATLALLRKDLPDINIETVPDNGMSNVPGGLLPPPEVGGQSPLPGGPSTAAPFKEMRIPGRIGFLLTARPIQRSSFTLSTITVTNKIPAITAYRFTLSPSAFLAHLFRQVLEVLVLALLLSVGIGWLLSRWLARPLSRLAAATEAVAGGNFQETVDRSGIMELDRLGEHFNRMVLTLRESFRSLATERDAAKRFAADAAHELKTPVATLRAYHDVLTERPERLRQVTPAVDRQIDRMEQVITGLLQIANLGEDGGIVLEPIDLGTMIRGLEPVYEALADESGLRLTTAFPEAPVWCRASQRLLELALNNLMDNAAKYTPPDGEVALTLEVDGLDALITVRDSGPGIPPEELPYIFDRFHRGVDTQCIPGTGLGLAIAREAVKRLDGTLAVESEVGTGSRFTIRLPLLEAR